MTHVPTSNKANDEAIFMQKIADGMNGPLVEQSREEFYAEMRRIARGEAQTDGAADGSSLSARMTR